MVRRAACGRGRRDGEGGIAPGRKRGGRLTVLAGGPGALGERAVGGGEVHGHPTHGHPPLIQHRRRELRGADAVRGQHRGIGGEQQRPRRLRVGNGRNAQQQQPRDQPRDGTPSPPDEPSARPPLATLQVYFRHTGLLFPMHVPHREPSPRRRNNHFYRSPRSRFRDGGVYPRFGSGARGRGYVRARQTGPHNKGAACRQNLQAAPRVRWKSGRGGRT